MRQPWISSQSVHGNRYTSIYHYIQSGGRDLTKKFNLSAERLSKEEGQAKLVAKRQGKLRELKEQADRELFERIDVALLDEDELLTGIV